LGGKSLHIRDIHPVEGKFLAAKGIMPVVKALVAVAGQAREEWDGPGLVADGEWVVEPVVGHDGQDHDHPRPAGVL
jgi:hypothetical protein